MIYKIHRVTPAAVFALLLACAVSAWAGQAQPPASGRPSPTEVRDAWMTLRQAMVATRNADNRGSIAVEEAEKRFVAHAETARLLLQGYDEPASGKVLPPGGTVTGDALVGGYFPTLARAYCAWMAAQRAKDPQAQLSYYAAVYETLWHGGEDAAASGESRTAKRQSRQLHAVYDAPLFRQMAVTAALARRRLQVELAKRAGETDVIGVSVAMEIADLVRLRKLPPGAFERVPSQPDVEDIVGKSGYLGLLNKSVQTALAAELAGSKPRFRAIVEQPDWQAEGRTKVVRGSVEALAPVTVTVVDAASGQPLPNAVQKNVSGEFDIRIDLEEKPQPLNVKVALDDPLSGESVTYERQIALWNIPQPTIAIAARRRTIAEVAVADLAFAVQRLRPGDKVAVVPAGSARAVLEQTVDQPGDRSFAVPSFHVAPNAETAVEISVVRGGRTVAAEQVVVSSRTRPSVTGRFLRVNDIVALIEATVEDYGQAVPRLAVNGRQYSDQVAPVETAVGGPDTRSRYVFLVPWMTPGQSATLSARTVNDADPVTVAWPSAPGQIAPTDPRLDRMPDYQRALARGDLDAAERTYLGILTDPLHADEAGSVLRALCDHRLRNAPSGATPEAEKYLGNLRILAKAVGRADELDSRLSQVRLAIQSEQERQRQAEEERKARAAAQQAKEQKEREEAERKAREAQKAREALEERARLEKTPVEVSVSASAYDKSDGILVARLEISGLVLGRTIKGVRVDEIDVTADALGDRQQGAGESGARSVVNIVAVPEPSAASAKVTVVVAYPNAGELPREIAVPLRPGEPGAMPDATKRQIAFLQTAGAEAGWTPPEWLLTMAGRRARALAAQAVQSVGSVMGDKRDAGALAGAQKAIARALEYSDALKGLTGADAGAEARDAQSKLTAALQPKLAFEGIALVKKPTGYALADSATVRVQSWADAVVLKFGDQAIKGTRSGGEWRFPLTGVGAAHGNVKVLAEATAGQDVLRAEQELTLEMPAASVAFNYTKPDFVYCDDGSGKRALVFSASDPGRNVSTQIHFDSPQAKLMAWDVVDAKGVPVPGTERSAKPPPLDGVLQIEDGKLGLGAYTVRIQLWDSEDASQTPARSEVGIRIAPRAVAFLVGINYYSTGQAPLSHAADDAMAIREKLIARGYAPENIIYVTGRNDSGTPEMRTNGLQNAKSATPSDLSETKRPGQRYGLVTGAVVRAAFDTFMKVVQQRSARHVLVFFAGHGTNVTAELAGSRTALNADHLIFADDEPTAPSKVYVWDWPTRLKSLVSWGSKDAPVTLMCVYDACRNGTKAPFDAAPPDLRTDDGAVLCSALFSCRKGEQANENLSDDPKLAVAYNNEVFKNGFFTYALLKGLDLLPAGDTRLPEVLNKAGGILTALVEQTPEKNRAAPGADKPYSERQSLPTPKDLRGWESELQLVYPVASTAVSSGTQERRVASRAAR